MTSGVRDRGSRSFTFPPVRVSGVAQQNFFFPPSTAVAREQRIGGRKKLAG